MIIVRKAELTDSPWLLTQLKAFAQFFGSKHSLFPTEDDDLLDALNAMIESKVFFVAENGQPVGFIAGMLSQHPYNPKITVLSELFWWVNPEHRGSSAGARLLSAFEDFGRANGADWIVMTLEAKSPVNEGSLTRRGFHLYERSYLKEVA